MIYMTENTKAAKNTVQITFYFIVIYKANIQDALPWMLNSFCQHFDVFRLIMLFCSTNLMLFQKNSVLLVN